MDVPGILARTVNDTVDVFSKFLNVRNFSFAISHNSVYILQMLLADQMNWIRPQSKKISNQLG